MLVLNLKTAWASVPGLTVHPALSCAQWITLLYSQLVVEPPIAFPLEKIDLVILPSESSVQVQGGSCEQAGDLPRLSDEMAAAQFIPLPVASALRKESNGK